MSVFHVLFSVPNHIYFSKYAFRLLPIIITQDSERLFYCVQQLRTLLNHKIAYDFCKAVQVITFHKTYNLIVFIFGKTAISRAYSVILQNIFCYRILLLYTNLSANSLMRYSHSHFSMQKIIKTCCLLQSKIILHTLDKGIISQEVIL